MLEPPWGFETPDYALRAASGSSIKCSARVARTVDMSGQP
jgi:hypothetical protein